MENLIFFDTETAFGEIGIAEQNERITQVFLHTFVPDKGFQVGLTPLLERAQRQLSEYFKGNRQEFDLPIGLAGTEFQQKVWKSLMEIPYGQTANYKEIACRIGNPKASRAVGMANNRNRLPILIPCHRVIGADGSLVGYAGGLERKHFLLELEKKVR